jgi:predicted DCC family thiol-disulfide oxidoreductase YuxK
MYFAALQGPYGSQLIARHPWLATVDSVVLVETTADGSEQIFVRSTAILRVAAYLGGWWQLLTLGHLLPACLRDWLYDAFARVRYWLFGQYESCPVPAPNIRARFL